MPEMKTLTVNGTKYEIVDEAARNLANSHAFRHAAGGADPITPSMIGAPKNLIGVLEGDVSLLDDALTEGHYAFLDTTGALGFVGGLYDVEVSKINYGGSLGYTQTAHRIYSNAYPATLERTYYVVGGWSAWKELATTDYALARDGSNEMTGTLTIQQQVTANFAADDIGVKLESWNDWNKRRFIWIPTELCGAGFNALQYVEAEAGNRYNILHTGNKPVGSYTGNGDATARTIDTGGIGKAVLIYESGVVFTIATPGGAISFRPAENLVTQHTRDKLMFDNGVLTIATSDTQVNYNGINYIYQVL